MAAGDKITADRFNQTRNKIAQVLGSGGTNPNTGSSDDGFGYGQSLVSYAVNQYIDSVTLADINALRSDLVKTRRHQTGIDYGAVGQINSDEYLGVFTNTTEIRDSDWAKYNTSADRAVNNRFSAATSSLTTETYIDSPLGGSSRGGILDRRNSDWSGTLVSEIRVDFNSKREADYFFNAGGILEIQPRLDYSGTDNKTLAWKQLLNEWIKTVRFTYNKTESFPSDASKKLQTNIGWYQLTTSYQEVFKRGSDGDYSSNFYSIQISTNSNKDRILFRITFEDGEGDETYTVIDERGIPYTVSKPDTPVKGVLDSEIRQLRPYNASNAYVRVTGPVAYIELTGI